MTSRSETSPALARGRSPSERLPSPEHLAALVPVSALCILCSLASLAAAERPAPSKPIRPGQLETSIARGIQFLITHQNKDGSWGSARNTKDLNIFAPVPGAHDAFRAGVTAMGIEALLETGVTATNTAARDALVRGEAWLIDHLPRVRRADGIALYNVWAHAYGIQTLAAMLHHEPTNSPRRDRMKEIIIQQYDLLRRYESVDGGWGYYDFRVQSKRPATDSTSFVSATALVAFHAARTEGVPPPHDLVQRAVKSIQRQRKQDFSYIYGEELKYQPMRPINRPGGSLGRSQACNIALRYWGDTNVTHTVLTNWLERLVTRNDWLSIGRKRPIPHESWFQVAGYFFYYGHYYAALCADELPADEARRYHGHLASLLVPLQEKDGSWWDFPFYDYHPSYGTAFALMTLARCRENAPKSGN
jgi:hypothetical protein